MSIRNKHRIELIILIVIMYIHIILFNSLIIMNQNAMIKKDKMENDYYSVDSYEIPLIASNWQDEGTIICDATEDQEYPKIISDGNGGAIIVWRDERESSGPPVDDIYAQRVNSTGHTLWDNNGAVICNETGNQYDPLLITDGNGGAIIVWEDMRTATPRFYAQNINSSGQTKWTKNGTFIYESTSDIFDSGICSDDDGGAIISWRDQTSGKWDIYALKINSTGAVEWKTTICNVTGEKDNPVICADGSGCAVVAWLDPRGSKYIYAQRIDSNGYTLWPDNGTLICNYAYGAQTPSICSDGQGNSTIVWVDIRDGFLTRDIYAQRIDSSGNAIWKDNGTLISNATEYQYYVKIINSTDGGAVITWEDWRDFTYTSRDIYAQKVNSTGDIQWDINGTVICQEIGDQEQPELSTDGSGGAIITWFDGRGGPNDDIYTQLINSTGQVQWTSNGTAICTSNLIQRNQRIVSDDSGGAYIIWEDQRKGTFQKDIYCQYVRTPENTSLNTILPNPDNDGIIYLNWTRIVYAFEYFVFRNTSEITSIDNLLPIATVVENNYTDTINSNGTYYYVVIARAAVGNSTISNCENVSVQLSSVLPNGNSIIPTDGNDDNDDDEKPPAIPGYDIYILIGFICIISLLIVKRLEVIILC